MSPDTELHSRIDGLVVKVVAKALAGNVETSGSSLDWEDVMGFVDAAYVFLRADPVALAELRARHGSLM